MNYQEVTELGIDVGRFLFHIDENMTIARQVEFARTFVHTFKTKVNLTEDTMKSDLSATFMYSVGAGYEMEKNS